ncbi:MAG: patatin [Woeseia sp.]|nr:patatin-like phospholipase family protein [Woeseia sp.]MBT8098043.1 patatin-like phospholipase family protein [Woeseia sp.]NNE60072.1 patatin [Woeseia sp.]NNL54759.1 patatin [Woeseia sp.]
MGSGASRGWSHIGVLKALLKAGIAPDVICGTSVGAMVGASYAAGNLDKLEEWVLGSSRTDILRFFSIRLARTAFVDKEKFNEFLHSFVAASDVLIEDLHCVYAAVCTSLDDGSEVWIRNGSLADAVRASMAMPGLFPPERVDDRWLVDGGLVNPVPVTTCRALGADKVIGINLNADILNRPWTNQRRDSPSTVENIISTLREKTPMLSESSVPDRDDAERPPGLLSAISKSINIFQDQITRGRLRSDPADVMISPQLAHIRMLDFQQAAEAIKEGEKRVQRAMSEISALVET